MNAAQRLYATERSAQSVVPLSMRWWDLDWSEHLPWALGDVSIEHGSFDEALPFIRNHYPTIFAMVDGEARWLDDPMTEAKLRFYRETDVLLARHGAAIVGMQLGHPLDWTTYYSRSLAILPEYQGRGLAAAIHRRMADPLRAAGVARLECHASHRSVAKWLRDGWVVTGTQNTDRWGSTIHLTKYLREDAEDVFRTHYCQVGAGPRRSHSANGAGRSTP